MKEEEIKMVVGFGLTIILILVVLLLGIPAYKKIGMGVEKIETKIKEEIEKDE